MVHFIKHAKTCCWFVMYPVNSLTFKSTGLFINSTLCGFMLAFFAESYMLKEEINVSFYRFLGIFVLHKLLLFGEPMEQCRATSGTCWWWKCASCDMFLIFFSIYMGKWSTQINFPLKIPVTHVLYLFIVLFYLFS